LIAEEKTAAELEECYFSEDELGLKLLNFYFQPE
jgi:hypothetical protein